MVEVSIWTLMTVWEKKGPCHWCEENCTDIRWCIANVDPPPETTLEEIIEDQEEKKDGNKLRDNIVRRRVN